jgi:hypothetical protein
VGDVFLTTFPELTSVVVLGGLVGALNDCEISFGVIELHNLD